MEGRGYKKGKVYVDRLKGIKKRMSSDRIVSYPSANWGYAGGCDISGDSEPFGLGAG